MESAVVPIAYPLSIVRAGSTVCREGSALLHNGYADARLAGEQVPLVTVGQPVWTG